MDKGVFSSARRIYIPVGSAAASLRQRASENTPLSMAVLFFCLAPFLWMYSVDEQVFPRGFQKNNETSDDETLVGHGPGEAYRRACGGRRPEPEPTGTYSLAYRR